MSAETVAEKVTPLALLAIDQFMVDHHLPPYLVKGVSQHCGAVRITVSERGADFETWSHAVDGDYLGTTTVENDCQLYVVVTERGSVPSPIGNVAVLLCSVQAIDDPEAVRSLQMVGGGAA